MSDTEGTPSSPGGSAWWLVDPRALAALRTSVGLAAVGKAAVLAATAPRLAAAEPPLPAIGGLSLRAVLPADAVPGLLLGMAVFGVLLILGPQARVSAATVAAMASGLLLFDGRMWSNHLFLLALLAALTAASGGGAWRGTRSLGGTWRGPRPRLRSPAAFLVCSQVAIVYLFAGLSKLTSTFLDGSVLASELALGPAAAILPSLPRGLLVALSVTTVVVEIALPVLLWLPRTRRWGAALGVAFHLGILAVVAPWPELAIFAMLTLGTYPLFLTRVPSRWTDRAAATPNPQLSTGTPALAT